jgi:hypothetical protein
MIAINKRYSYPRVKAIRIDVHPAGENPTNTSHAFHAPSAYSPRPYVSTWLMYSNLSRSRQQIWTDPLAREEGLPTQSTARRLTDLWVRIQLLSHNSQWSSGKKSSFCWQLATRLTGPIYQHTINTFNTCSREPTHRSLTDTGGGYNLGRANFSHTTPWPS